MSRSSSRVAPAERASVPAALVTSKTMVEIGQVIALVGVAFYGGQKLEQLDGGIRGLNVTMTRLADESATKAELRELRLELRAQGIALPPTD